MPVYADPAYGLNLSVHLPASFVICEVIFFASVFVAIVLWKRVK